MRSPKTTRKPSGGVLASARRRTAPSWSWSRLSLDRKLDIAGVALVLLGLLTLLSLFSSNHGSAIGLWVQFINMVAGWGAFILPVGVVLVGVWLVLRNVERLPMLSAERLTGVALLYLNILAWMHLWAGGGWEIAQAGEGGGYTGALFERLTVGALGSAGAVIAFVAWSLIAILLTLDVSVTEIFHFFQMTLASLAHRINRQLDASRSARAAAQSSAVPAAAGPASNSANARDTYVPELDALGRPRLDTLRRPENNPANGPATSVAPADTPPGASSALPNDFHPLNTGRSARRPGADPSSRAVHPESSSAAAASQPAASLPPWKLPDVTTLLETSGASSGEGDKAEEDRRSRIIEETLASFGAPVKVVKVNAGPTVTQFGVEPQYVETRNGKTRVRVSKIVNLADDLALALAAPRIRIQAPVPGRNYVGVEVPNSEISRVLLRDVLESDAFRKIKSPMRFALGKDVGGHARAYDLAAMPHLLIAGTTGSGKSVLVNAILSSLLLYNTPNELRMILVDPKRVELTGYNGIPHLLSPVIVEAEEVIGALQWVQREMDARYHKFSQQGARNIADYNARNNPPLPYMLVLVDELADLMMLAPDETERALTRLAQLARATGIHLVLATQRPSVDVVTGLIKANFPARVAFAVASGVDSRVILDQPGAERLLGRGDMLFQAPDAAAPVRLQGVFVSDPEIQRVVDYWRQQAYDLRNVNIHTTTATPVNMDVPLNAPLKQTPLFNEETGGSGDPIMQQAIQIVREEGHASISMLQRKLRIGYTRSARLIDQMEELGIIGPSQPTSQVREVLNLGNENDAQAENNLDTGHEG